MSREYLLDQHYDNEISVQQGRDLRALDSVLNQLQLSLRIVEEGTLPPIIVEYHANLIRCAAELLAGLVDFKSEEEKVEPIGFQLPLTSIPK